MQDIKSILLFVILLILSAFFSATETAFSAVSRARLKAMAENGRIFAVLALKLSEKYDELLSTILIGNNIVNISASVVAALWFSEYYPKYGEALTTVVVTTIILIFGEFTPKALAKELPERVAMMAAPAMKILLWLLKPVNWFMLKWKERVTKKVAGRIDPAEQSQMTGEELRCIVDEAQHEGGITPEAGELLRSAIEFRDLEAYSVCTPRVRMTALQEDASYDEINAAFEESGYSRLPVYRKSIDDIIGIIHLKDFHYAVASPDFRLEKIVKPTIYAPRSMHIHELLKQMQKQKIQLAIVVDEFGGTLGMVTMEDILEELVGEIYDEQDEIPVESTQLSDGSYKIDCQMELDNFRKQFNVEMESESTTVNGWLWELFGHNPDVGETRRYDGLEIKVLRADEKNVLEIEVSAIAAETEQ